jgi:methyl-accepting chemotaxis protein
MAELMQMSKEEREQVFRKINEKSDRIMTYAMWAYMAFGLLLATFYNTYLIAIGVGSLCLVAYFLTKMLLPQVNLYRYVLSAVLAIFSALYIYQMHGLFEMHFFFFVGATLLVTYRNWKLIIPLLLLTVIHHASFAWLQYKGMKEIYFTQLDYMDLQAFMFHAFLAAVIMGICGYWSYDLERTTVNDSQKTVFMEKQMANVTKNISFANEISKGNLDVEYASLDNHDELGKSLLAMQQNLKTSNVREQQEKFITVGITKIGDIIRKHGNDPAVLVDEFIKCIVNYTNLNQGGLFLLENESNDPYLKLVACYAYDRKKFLNKRIELGQGLVGQCFLEKEPAYLTQIPGDYVKITSGLGQATPRSIYLQPVQTKDETVGVIELASFNELKDFEKQFILRAAENIASAIISSSTNQRIKLLLTDEQQRAEEMKAQEEEMRQNMEELQATQEEIYRKQVENENRIKAVNESGIASVEFSLDGIILDANEPFLNMMGYTLSEVQGKHHRIFVDKEYANSEEYRKFWEDLGNGVPRPGEYKRLKKTGKKVYIKGTYSVIRDRSGKPLKILKLANDITRIYDQQAALQRNQDELLGTLTAINESMAVIEFNNRGEIQHANPNFLNLLKYQLSDVIGKHHSLFVDADDRESPEYKKFWSDLSEGKTIKGEFKRIDKNGNPKWIRGNYSPIRSKKGDLVKIIKIAYDISSYKSTMNPVSV